MRRQSTEQLEQDLEEFYLYRKIDITLHPQDSDRAEFFDFFSDDDVTNALENIPEKFRLPLILSDVEDFSISEIADLVKTSSQTVISRLSKGRKLLQRSLWNSLTMK
jgi:RNA polymerase sigma-70 factor (ECF subfamily)